MKQLITIALLCCSVVALAQVEATEKVIMTGNTTADRQVRGLATPVDSSAAVNVATVQDGTLSYAVATGTNNLTVALTPALNQYQAGTVINFKASNNSSGATTLNVNGLGAISIKKAVTEDLDSLDIRTGQLVSVIYDGINFQLLSAVNKSCPNGFIKVSARYCIDSAPRDSLNYWDANQLCQDMGAKLCSWSEWIHVCFDATNLGATDMGNFEEWVDSAANTTGSGGQAKTAGYKFTTVTYGCDQSGYGHPQNTTRRFRCCYLR